MSSYSGSLHIRFGPMTSGKTTWLNNELSKCIYSELLCVKIISKKDDRLGNELGGSTHNSMYTGLGQNIQLISTNTLSNIDVSSYDVIGLDEAQFFPDLTSCVLSWVNILKKQVLVVGLDGDFKREKFGSIIDLIPEADSVEKITSTCSLCIKEQRGKFRSNPLELQAAFSKRLTTSTDQLLIGGTNIYQATCRYHHNN